MEIRKFLLNTLGIWFILLGLGAIFSAINSGDVEQIFWFCYVGLILIGFGLIKENGNLIVIQLNILTIPLIIWNIDFYYSLITGDVLWGITSYIFNQESWISTIVSFHHVYTVILSFIALYFIKFDKKSLWKYSFLEMAILFVFGIFLSSPEFNVNCVYRNCLPFDTVIPYWIVWFIFVFLGVLITNKIIERVKIFRK